MKHAVLILILFFTLQGWSGNSDKEKSGKKTYSGKVTDLSGETIPGARLFVEETGETFFGDLDGNFKITLQKDQVFTITIDNIGFEPLKIKSNSIGLVSELSLRSL